MRIIVSLKIMGEKDEEKKAQEEAETEKGIEDYEIPEPEMVLGEDDLDFLFNEE